MTGHRAFNTARKCTYGALFVGTRTTFLVQHWLGAEGMPRRYADYLAADSAKPTPYPPSEPSSWACPRSPTPHVWRAAHTQADKVDDPLGYGRSPC